MSKPLTIDELRALGVGDCVWIVSGDYGFYDEIDEDSNPDMLCLRRSITPFVYRKYGKKWLAWKNKEQAEAKGEIVELPCIRKTLASYELVYLNQYAQIKTERFDVDELPKAERRLAELKGEKI